MLNAGPGCVAVVSRLGLLSRRGLCLVGLILSVAGSGPTDISAAWDAFFNDWVKPVVHFGTPVLIVFAVLLTLTRVLTGVLVTKDSPGIRSAKTSARLPVSVMYWFGVICLLYSVIEATVVFPLARNLMFGKPKRQPRHLHRGPRNSRSGWLLPRVWSYGCFTASSAARSCDRSTRRA